MALISCFTGPQSLQGMLTCLRDTEGMTGILVVVTLLAGWLVVQHLADARRERRAWESRPGIPVPQAQCGSARHADAVHGFANRQQTDWLSVAGFFGRVCVIPHRESLSRR